MHKVEDYEDIHKIILVGDTSVGKTNIVYVYTKQKQPINIGPTVGVQFNSKIVKLQDNQKVNTQIWDTAGQQQYRAVTMINYRNAIGAMVVFDVTNRNTFEHVQQWIQSIRDKAHNNCQIILVGHKIDSINRQVSHNQGHKIAVKEGIPYVQTTVKDFSTINRAFQTLLTNVCKVSKYYNPDKNIKLSGHEGNSGCKC